MATNCIACGNKVTDATVFMALHKMCSPAKGKCERCQQEGHHSPMSKACPYHEQYVNAPPRQRGWWYKV